MQQTRKRLQQIAVFGESGSGKTVLVSSFYGAAQEPAYRQRTGLDITADDIGQGARLHRNYLGMKNSATLPAPTHFAATSYSFSIKLARDTGAESRSKPFDALRLVWHDYPGEWFEQGVSGPEEAQRRADTFRSLLSSDVAFIMVDGQRLLDNAGEEGRYLKSLMGNLRNGLVSLREDLLPDGTPLTTFPRIWVLALSKADLLPAVDAYAFRDLLVEKASDEITELREVVRGMVEAPDALSIGEDFVLLSSAKFEPEMILVSQRIGLDLVLPLAAILPLERHVRWAKLGALPRRLADPFLGKAKDVAHELLSYAARYRGGLGRLIFVLKPMLEEAANLGGDRLREANARAIANHDRMTETLTGFKMALESAELETVLIRSRQ